LKIKKENRKENRGRRLFFGHKPELPIYPKTLKQLLCKQGGREEKGGHNDMTEATAGKD